VITGRRATRIALARWMQGAEQRIDAQAPASTTSTSSCPSDCRQPGERRPGRSPLTAAAEAPCPVRAAPAQASLAHRRLRA
jgi:hypothetical protein